VYSSRRFYFSSLDGIGRRLRVFENRVLRRIFGPKRDEVKGNGENYIARS
jgi:hypothetical protein